MALFTLRRTIMSIRFIVKSVRVARLVSDLAAFCITAWILVGIFQVEVLHASVLREQVVHSSALGGVLAGKFVLLLFVVITRVVIIQWVGGVMLISAIRSVTVDSPPNWQHAFLEASRAGYGMFDLIDKAAHPGCRALRAAYASYMQELFTGWLLQAYPHGVPESYTDDMAQMVGSSRVASVYCREIESHSGPAMIRHIIRLTSSRTLRARPLPGTTC